MKWNYVLIIALVLMVGFLGSCKTNQQDLDAEPYTSGSITTELGGFSPLAKGGRNTMELALSLGNPALVKSWLVVIQSGDKIYRTYGGLDSNAPPVLEWDGKDELGTLAPDGRYHALLSEYTGVSTIYRSESTNFVLVTAPPSGSIQIEPVKPQWTKTGFLVPIAITIKASSTLADLESWSLDIRDPSGKIVRNYADTWPAKKVFWDGMSNGGKLVPFTTSYTVQGKVRDQFGNIGLSEVFITVEPMPLAATAVLVPKPSGLDSGASINPQATGFSPNGDKTMDSMVFAVDFGQPKAVKSWTLDIINNNKTVRQFANSGSTLPSEIVWDGKKTDGFPADQGLYTAKLSIDFGGSYKPLVLTTPVLTLATEAPKGSIALSEALFSPIESNPIITVSFQASTSKTKMENWTMRILDPEGNLFRSFEGEWPNTRVEWDGMGRYGNLVDSAEDYLVQVTVHDELGNASILNKVLPVDILVEESDEGYRILSSRIFFRAYTSDYSSVSATFASQNKQRLDNLAEKLKKFPGYRIKIVGHAVMIYWDNPSKGAIEQDEVLIPLSAARADAIAKALVARGFDPKMLSSSGSGAADPLVPDSDLVNRWRNRRVSIFLLK